MDFAGIPVARERGSPTKAGEAGRPRRNTKEEVLRPESGGPTHTLGTVAGMAAGMAGPEER